MLTHDDQELGVESREGGLQRVAGVEIIESRHTISPESAQLVLAGSPGLRLGNIHQKFRRERREGETFVCWCLLSPSCLPLSNIL